MQQDVGICRDLDNGQRLPREISLIILDQLCECSVDPFKHQFFALRNTILDELRESHGLSDSLLREQQETNKWITYEILLNKADAAYKTLRDLDKWGPNVHNIDRSVVPDTMISQAEVNVLVQRALGTYRRNQNNNGGNQSGSSSEIGRAHV